MIKATTICQGPGPDAAGTTWTIHGAAMVDQWLHDFSWKKTPLAEFITGVDVAFDEHPATSLWRSAVPGRAVPSGPPLTNLPPLDEAPFNMWHPLWFELVNVWHLTGTWLHPESHFCTDQLAFAEERAYLYVGCHDREYPSGLRRYDPDRSPISHDQGVTAFPLRTFRALEFHADGHCPEAAMLLCAGIAVVESAVHEALEMHQSSPGIPVLDPHASGLTVKVTAHWAHGGPSTVGYAHVP
ncbi:hypothetical protein [Streptomyces lydicus]|uniref:hypothetical protein n=1 Tax=Streptomyces lydicus TaxID=47763 RepID=UPI0010124A57|nr:hypothetical protein [Streptomyces lydicus]MCZ1012314.1 hypothetical protein [Streptomyces lydicus]